MNKSLVKSILLCACVLSGCRDGGPVDPAVTPPELLELWQNEQQVIANCYTVQEAVEAFAADNAGVYPDEPSTDRNLSGNNVIDLLPGGTHLLNPFNGRSLEPGHGWAAYPGAIGYIRTVDDTGTAVDYVITGFGETETILVLTRYEVVVRP